jgi:hypothetical protein
MEHTSYLAHLETRHVNDVTLCCFGFMLGKYRTAQPEAQWVAKFITFLALDTKPASLLADRAQMLPIACPIYMPQPILVHQFNVVVMAKEISAERVIKAFIRWVFRPHQ